MAPKNASPLVGIFFAIAIPQAYAAQTVTTIGTGPMTHGKAKKDIYPTKLVQAQHFKHDLQLSIF
ncbi:hypothetical protein HFN88_03240 [Rhizobium laguerreae]|uniref:hypothetical protein n=1 Tax=Rhizobium laguerreae TaxID=1076926 RepID=UPI0013F15487|nr:hypothetical protein [Rhizobium laguerreae]MBY3270822.1 hypothetical protein [Rhizobium laguerreae]MBY3298019.1 hypothetical protein [Rhizobium laguerreae]MBY3310038.1 hypothetical protein [Rhizobium laguerreae]MBY3322645.1 hypothetical protein [Rhizobium laguerreae]MBY3391709.1 hypothetical protein [Rhizobium laguerreae]